MTKKDFNFYDRIVENLIVYIYSVATRDMEKKIILKDFNLKDTSHKLFFKACQQVNIIAHYPIYVTGNFFKFLSLKFKMRKIANVHYILKSKIFFDIDKELTHIATVNGSNLTEWKAIYSDIYYSYYGKERH